jgi:predicted GTPase
VTSASSLSGTARQLLQRAIEAYRDSPETQRWLRGELERIDAPLQVAIAGKVKAGKSTLLNAMVGEMVAATDAAECTKLVTWYQYAAVTAGWSSTWTVPRSRTSTGWWWTGRPGGCRPPP